MQIIIILSAILTFAVAAPASLEYNAYVPLSKATSSSQAVDHGSTHVLHPVIPLAKSTLTHSSQMVDHGSTQVLHPVIPLSKSTLTHSSQIVDHGSTQVLHPVIPLAKSTLTHSSQTVDHGSTHVLHAPILMHDVEYHVPLAKTTVTNNNHVVDHGSSTLIHSPLVHTHVAQSPVFVHSGSIVSYKNPDSAVSHHSSTVHETLPIVNSYYAFH